MRLQSRHVRGHRPFATRGVSLYLVDGASDPGPDAIPYRRHQLASAGSLHGVRTGPGGTGSRKTDRVAFAAHPATTLSYALPAALANRWVRLQLRTCDSDIECETTQRTMLIRVDPDRVEIPTIQGVGRLLDMQARVGGVCRVKFRYDAVPTGLQPTQFGYVFVSGGGVTAAVAPAFRAGQTLYDIDLTCATTTVVDITAVVGAVSLVLFRVTLVPDLSGPPAPTSLTARTV